MRALAIAAAVTAVLSGSVLMAMQAAAQTQPSTQGQTAQPMTWQERYNTCANNGRFDQRLTGQQLIDYIDNCVKHPMSGSSEPPVTSWNEMYAACADEGRFEKNLSGQELTDFVWKCASQPVSGSSLPPTESSWQDKRRACADDGRQKQGLSGNDLINFVDTCLAKP